MSTFIKGKKWYVDFRFERQRIRKPSPDNSKRGAEAYEAVLRTKLARGENISAIKNKQIIFEKFIGEWMRVYVQTNNKISEQKSKQLILNKHLIPFFGGKTLDNIKQSDIERYKSLKINANLSHKTINNHLTVLRKALITAADWGNLNSVPTFKWLKVMKPEPRFLSRDEALRLIDAMAAEPWKEMVFLALNTGMRLGEILAVRWEDIDWLQGTLTVNQSVACGIIGTPKSNRFRRIPLTVDALKMLERRQKTIHTKNGLIFSDNGKIFSRFKADYAIKEAARQAGIENVYWHALRHTFASHLVQDGAPLKSIQSLLGHSTIAMTERYSHLSQSTLESAIALIDFGTLFNDFGHPVVTEQKNTLSYPEASNVQIPLQ